MNPFDLLVGPLLFFSIWGGFRFFRKKDPPAHTETKSVKKFYEYQKPGETYCPMCNQLYNFNSHKFCTCETCPVGHFHITCVGTFIGGAKKGQACGCGFEWIMKGLGN
jgi:hypothetical protein